MAGKKNNAQTAVLDKPETAQDSVILYRRFNGQTEEAEVGRFSSLAQAELELAACADEHEANGYTVDRDADWEFRLGKNGKVGYIRLDVPESLMDEENTDEEEEEEKAKLLAETVPPTRGLRGKRDNGANGTPPPAVPNTEHRTPNADSGESDGTDVDAVLTAVAESPVPNAQDRTNRNYTGPYSIVLTLNGKAETLSTHPQYHGPGGDTFATPSIAGPKRELVQKGYTCKGEAYKGGYTVYKDGKEVGSLRIVDKDGVPQERDGYIRTGEGRKPGSGPAKVKKVILPEETALDAAFVAYKAGPCTETRKALADSFKPFEVAYAAEKKRVAEETARKEKEVAEKKQGEEKKVLDSAVSSLVKLGIPEETARKMIEEQRKLAAMHNTAPSG